jgi:hypothetical protein
MKEPSLHARLVALGHKIEAAEARLREKAHLYPDETHQTRIELKDRYARLMERLNEEIAGEETHGQHVSDLERSVHQWMESIDTSHIGYE